MSQSELVGAELVVADDRQRKIRVRLDAVETDPLDPDREITLYAVSVWDEALRAWSPLCDPGPDGLPRAFPLTGQWTPEGRHVPAPGQFMMTCTSGAIGRCVRLGYKPWRNGPDGESLWDTHQACTRMMRADYCGDGSSFTREGNSIDVYDPFGIQKSAGAAARGFSFEAAWSPEGALCVAHPRVPELTSLEQLVRHCPARLEGRTGAQCTEARMQNEPSLRVMNRSP